MDIGGEGAVAQDGEQNEDRLNISDVFEAITLADPSFGAGGAVDDTMERTRLDEPYVQIVEQPASKALRFRYECEGRSAGSIPGVNSSSDNKTFPTIKICNYTGQIVIVVSCVTKDQPYRPHPHNLVGRERCERGVCTIPTRITEDTREYQFKNLGIQCVKRRDIAEALRNREQLRVDPFRTGFGHRNHPQSIDLNAVRLCFQVFLPDETGRMRRPLPPAVSDVIYDKKAMSDLLIMRASHCSGTARGGTQVILLCEKVTREDTAVVFYQEENNQVLWEENAITILVHKQVAIAFETPPFRNPHTTEHVNVRFQLKRMSDNVRSNSLPFEYIPEYTDMRNKRRKVVSSVLQNYEHERLFQPEKPIKSEPKDKMSPHHISSPPLQVYAPQYEWVDNIQAGMGPGPSHNPFAQEMWSQANFGQASPLQCPVSPHMQQVSPNMQQMAQNLQVMSPHAQAMSPGMQPMSPNMQVMSPHAAALSPRLQVLSPAHAALSPAMGRLSPNMHNMGHVSPNLVQQPTYVQQQVPPQNLMDTDGQSTSLSHLLGGADPILLNSGELSGLSSLLGDVQ